MDINKKVELFKVAALDFNKNVEMINKFIKYFDELDNYKYGIQHKLSKTELHKIKTMGFRNYCEMIYNKMSKYEEQYNIIGYYIEYELEIKLSDKQIKNGIDLKGMIKLPNTDMMIQL